MNSERSFGKCETCDGVLWVCENHNDKPWGDTPLACDCGWGVAEPCDCNPFADLPPGFKIICSV